jgi:hypothetical protein
MTVTIKVNGTSNSLVHKGSMGISTATVPDVCKTPSPGGPIPIPYPNISQSSSLDKGTTTVKADGGMMIAIKGSEFSLSNGDEAGTVGGVKSSTFMKESTWILYSFDVKMEGKNACRLSDKKFQNHENTADMSGVVQDPKTVEELAELLCEISKQCEDKVNSKYQNKPADGSWCWSGKPPNAFKVSREKHECCKDKVNDLKKNAKYKLKETHTEPACTVADLSTGEVTGSIKPDIVVGTKIPGGVQFPAEAIFDFKFSCPTGSKPQWPQYGGTKAYSRRPPHPDYDGMKQDEIYRDELGPKPQMVHEKGDAC